MKLTQEQLINEEQKILNNLIREMDDLVLELKKGIKYEDLQARKAREKCLPDTYGALLSALGRKAVNIDRTKTIRQGRNELYNTRMIAEFDEGTGRPVTEELRVGLHTITYSDRLFIVSWTSPMCRHFILDNGQVECDSVITDRYDRKIKTHITVKLRRRIDLRFDKVKQVFHLYPLVDEEEEKIIADAFLQELLKRRAEREFQNIVFSIQKQQGEIIQTPFRKNLIVQGCAGSGKSMIMLHRLPIILLDNPNELNRNHLYIITPSVAYIQLADSMRRDLEIEDLNMGTMEQYYNFIIQRYNRKPEEYGILKDYRRLSEEQIRFAYSPQCVFEIRQMMVDAVRGIQRDCTMEYRLLGLGNRPFSGNTIPEQIQSQILMIQDALDENESRLKQNHGLLWNAVKAMDEFRRALSNRKLAVTRKLDQLINAEEEIQKEAGRDLLKINRVEHELMYKNRLNTIEASKKKVEDYKETKELVELDQAYFQQLIRIANQLTVALKGFQGIAHERENVKTEDLYQAMGNYKFLIRVVLLARDQVSSIQDYYWEYADSLESCVKKLISETHKLEYLNTEYLPQDIYNDLLKAKKRCIDLRDHLIRDVYTAVLDRLGVKRNRNGAIMAIACSPYLYCQILYCYYGAPNTYKESLITIDEAQNVAPEEIKLLQAVNGNRVILNLYGDVKQHIEGTKGIDSWDELKSMADFSIYNMRENYRNARQITEYCNRKFGLDMRAINLDGDGVHEIKNLDSLKQGFRAEFTKPVNAGLMAIIVNGTAEVKAIREMNRQWDHRIHDLTKDDPNIQTNVWNLMTVDQARGLEFEVVFAITGRMSKNEKYIASTRALNELFVYDEKIPLENGRGADADGDADSAPGDPGEGSGGADSKPKDGREEKTKRKIGVAVKEYFESKGLEVIDQRQKTGFMWVIGDRKDLEPYVNHAVKEFGISGAYSSGKATGNRPGWYTKTRK